MKPESLVEFGAVAPLILEAVEVVFNNVAQPVDAFVAEGFADIGCAARNDRQSVAVEDAAAIIGFVGADGDRRLRGVEHRFDGLAILRSAAGQNKLSGRPLPSTAVWIFALRPSPRDAL